MMLARAGERLAVTHLSEVHGLELVATNLRVAVDGLRGELDVVMQDSRSGLLVVCEVKSRTVPRVSGGAGALEALGARQQARIRRMVAVLLADRTLQARGVRFDLVALDAAAPRAEPGATLQHLAGAW
jgi:Holliday junction resolvase-like predicted endonuclease